MAYFTGVFGKDIRNREFSLDNNTCIYRNDNFILFSGGNEKRMYSEVTEDSVYVFAGMAIKKGKINNKQKYTQGDEPDYGHYACADYSNKKLTLFCDPTGTRTIYYALENSILYFSTRLDHVSTVSSNTDIDWKTIGSLFANGSSMNNTTEITNIRKLMPGQALICNEAGKISLNKTARRPEKHSASVQEVLMESMTIDKHLDLALSGGVDSRMLLAVLKKNDVSFSTHTHGTENDTDVIVAKQMTDDMNIRHRVFQDTSSESMMNNIRHFLIYNPANPGLFRARLFKSFSKEYSDNECIIDGSYGEFYRKTRYLTWAYAFHRGIRDPRIIKRAYSRNIPGLFNPDIRKSMEEGVLEHIENAQKSFTKQKYFKSIVDFLFFNYGNANNWSREQARIDELAYAYMPFAQMRIVHASLYPRTYISANTIKDIYPDMSKYPFAKSGKTVPFNDRRKWRRKLMNRTHSVINEDICVMLNDAEIREFLISDHVPDEFDRHRIKDMIIAYYKGNGFYSSSLNTYLSLRLVPYLFK